MQQHFNLTDFKVGDVVTFPERGARVDHGSCAGLSFSLALGLSMSRLPRVKRWSCTLRTSRVAPLETAPPYLPTQ